MSIQEKRGNLAARCIVLYGRWSIVGVLALLAPIGCESQVGTCLTNETLACECADGREGVKTCVGDSFGACQCSAGLDAGPDAEPADAGRDASLANDCDDGTFDSGDICTVVSSTASAYISGEVAPSRSSIQQFWPVLSPVDRLLNDSSPAFAHFRPNDRTLFYSRGQSIARDDLDAEDPLVDTFPCRGRVGHNFGFDPTGALTFACRETDPPISLYREGGALLVPNIDDYVGTTSRGRIITVMANEDGTRDFVAFDDSATELARLSPHEDIGELVPSVRGSVIDGEFAVALYVRTDPRELVSYVLTSEDVWQPSRRQPLLIPGQGYLALPNGLLFVHSGGINDNAITLFDLIGGSQELWRDDESVLRGTTSGALFVGPAFVETAR